MEEWWKHKLFQPKNIEGEPVKEELDYVRELFKLASEADPRLKGITIIGSTLKGYAYPESKSDIDIGVFCDNPAQLDSRGHHEVDDFFAKFLEAEKELNSQRETKNLPVFKTEVVLINNDANYLTPDLIKDIKYLGTIWAMECLIFPGVGDLESYRNIVRNEINTYSKTEKEEWLKCLVDSVAKHLNSRKSLARGLIQKEEEQDFLEARKRLVDARVRRIFG